MFSKIKKLPIGLQIIGGGASLFFLYQMYKIAVGNDMEKKKALQDKAEAKTLFESKITYSPEQLIDFTQSLKELLQYGIGKNIGDLEAILMRMNNNIDVQTLYNSFGKQMTYLYGSPTGQKTLPQIFATIEPEDKNKINIDWKKKNIKFKI